MNGAAVMALGSTGRRLYLLDFLRLIFAFYVLLSHTLSVIGVRNRLWLVVEFYFVLSGFLLAYRGSACRSLLSFVLEKWLRFLPMVLLGGFLVMTVLPLNPMAFLCDIFLLNVWTGDNWNAPSWYISVLLPVSVFCWAGMRFVRERNFRNLLFIFVVIASSYVLMKHGIGPYGELYHGIPLRMLRGLCEMSAGVLAADILLSPRVTRFLREKAVCCSLVGAVCLLPCFYRVYPRFWLLYVALSAVTIASVALRPNKCRIFSEIGRKYARYAFPIFCTHYFLIYWLEGWIKGHPEVILLERLAVGSVVVIVGLAVGLVGYHFVERPCMCSVRRLMGIKKGIMSK